MNKASLFKRYEGNPILKPTVSEWEAGGVFNAGAWERDGKIELLYRGIDKQGKSNLGYAWSKDGFSFERLAEPLLKRDETNAYETWGMEDPRVTFLDGCYNIVYVAASQYSASHPKPVWSYDAPWRARVALVQTKDFVNFERRRILVKDEDSKDGALFPERINNKLWLLHRIYPDVTLSIGQNWGKWESQQTLFGPREGMWDNDRVGAGPPPLKTKEGWLLIYHGKDDLSNYRQGAVLLDLKDPRKVIARSREPFLVPEKDYETILISHNRSVAVFICGMIQRGDELLVYYGASDKYLCAGTVSLSALLGTLEKVRPSFAEASEGGAIGNIN